MCPHSDETALCCGQPWASLLMHGIKGIEGHAWSSRHRLGLNPCHQRSA